ncbi:GNAT family N-acetyltransferase [Erwiniaceae bacterium BAC15a-03b]|uniref:GNAT family N-acetyltransferase n=1 Tax=Winslowiella arboricola TaxID=2978220 RepID=A0A9J6PW52_9GAMM|nr:GNAT family N-acetyltransferase [Winslowiella arboricola]MCU5772546.1 GNAT family N-acetyltransferase [Winslowiella arboricola]MCU5779068.1 GNAT family N-acetyltransferase [Winslowiella arboricola]
MSIQLRAMSERDLDGAFALTQQMKWPHRRADWQQALQLGAGVVAEEQGQLTGTALCWRWGSDYATLGLVIVDGAAQGRGIGKQLMLAVLEKLSGSHVRLHATEAGKGLYEKLGFVATGYVEQHQCPELAEIAAIPLAADQQLRQAQPQDAALLTMLDQQAHGQHRPQLIAALLGSEQPLLVLEQDGQPQGFACLRRFGHGYAIGPVIARDLASAQLLVTHLLSGISGQFVRIDTDASSGLGDWLTAQGLAKVDAPTTMVKGTPWQPAAGAMQVFGLMTQAMA